MVSEKNTPWSLVMIVYIQWLGRGIGAGLRVSIFILNGGSVGATNGVSHTYMIVKMGSFMVVTWTDSYKMLPMKY